MMCRVYTKLSSNLKKMFNDDGKKYYHLTSMRIYFKIYELYIKLDITFNHLMDFIKTRNALSLLEYELKSEEYIKLVSTS